MKKVLSILLLAFSLLFGAYQAPEVALNVLTPTAVSAVAVYTMANHRLAVRRSALVQAINTLPPSFGTHENGKPYFSSAAIAAKYLLGKLGADKDHIAVLAATSDEPIGVISDEATAAEEAVSVELLAITKRTLPMVAGAAITLGADLYATAAGKVVVKPTAAGTYWKVGQALEPADGDNDVIEVLPQRPRKLIVVSALESTNGTAAGASASLANLAAETEKLGDDLRKIAAAQDNNADVALATT